MALGCDGDVFRGFRGDAEVCVVVQFGPEYAASCELEHDDEGDLLVAVRGGQRRGSAAGAVAGEQAAGRHCGQRLRVGGGGDRRVRVSPRARTKK